ncbi:MAG: OmpA family protein [Muribaculaceae bacterium]|nr:OmpA family protein [Muribaculaceae bacterium]
MSMKKLVFLFVAIAMITVAAQAQVTVKGSKFTDNWSLTLKGGAVSPFQNYAFWPSARGIWGAELRKQVTSVIGLGVEGEWTVNTSSWNKQYSVWGGHSSNIFDHQLVGAFGTVNFANWFGGYKGEPRSLEVEGVLGSGWWHGYKTPTHDDNSWYTKAGLNINYNLGESKAWTVALKPAVVWYMGQGASQSTTAMNANRAMVEMEAGLTYHFGNSNGQHYMTLCDKQYTQADIDALNAEINALRARKPETKVVEKIVEKVVEKPVEKVVENSSKSLEANVFFAQGKSVVTAAQMPNVERVATFLKNNAGSTVVIKGYASPEGSKEINERLANARAKAVKDLLVNKYKIAANRINAQGLGVGDMFSEPDWNRVSVCTINVGE